MYGLQEKAKCETVGHYSNKPIHPMDAGFLMWVRIPDDHKFWCEMER